MKSPLIHLAVALVLLVTVLVGYAFWYATIAAKSVAVTALQSQIDAKLESASRVATTQTALTEVASDEAIVQSYFVPETGVVAFIDGLQAEGHSLGTNVSVLSVSTGTGTKQKSLAFALSVKGTFDAVMRTIGAIEYAPFDISISTLVVGLDAKNSWHANLEMVVGSVSAKVATTSP